MTHRLMALTLAFFVSLTSQAQGLRPPAAGVDIQTSVPQIRAPSDGPLAADYIVAVVNSEPITRNEVQAALQRMQQQLAQQRRSQNVSQELVRQVLERLINEKVQLQEARETGIRIDDVAIDQAEQNIARQNQMDVAQLRQRITQEGALPSQFRDQLRDQLTLTRLRERDIEPRVRVSDLEVDQYLREPNNKLPDMTVTQSRARHILLHLSPQLSEAAARDKLSAFKKSLAAGQADFAALARAHSQDSSAAQGGDLGWANPGMFVPEFEEVMNRLEPGQISDPLVSRFGVHLIELLERRQATLSPREQREAVRAMLREKKLDEAYALWAQDLRGRAYVELREPAQ